MTVSVKTLGWLFGVLAAIFVVVEQRDVGIARDEVVYMQAGAKYAAWWVHFADHGFDARSITQTFGGGSPTDNNREHPPLMKTWFGLSELVLHQKLGALDEVTAFRLPSAVMHGVGVVLVFRFALALWGLGEAILAALVLIGLPRALFHAGLACFDAPSMTLWFATVVAYWHAMEGRRWPWPVGVVWGLALATKHTALLVPFALGVHYLVVGWRASQGAGGVAARLRATIAYRGRVIVSLVVLGPLTLFVVWPWLWIDPIHHVADWLAFHLHHVHYNYEYLGRNWNAPRFPWHVALVTTLFTVPVATLAAALIGAGAWLTQRERSLPGAPALLLALSAAASIGPFFLGTTPIFGAEKHWMPALPTICIAAGVGVVWVARRAVQGLAWLPEAAVIAGLGGLVVLAAASEVSVAEPYALTWYNTLAGGAPGGADLGMNRQFWGVAARGVLPALAQAAGPSLTSVYTHDASPAWGTYQRAGVISRSLIDAGPEQAGIDRSQLALVIHELHFNRHDFMIWSSYGTVQPIFVLRAAGVPIVSLYRRPPK
ncbi:MAG TPA: glycosyltransferase family 39 protein [Kofleriaceae bacterium]|nr:glycosyltransferase family 39 protein [Kofleriaceae bacterium]